MPAVAERSLPIAAEHREFTVRVGGQVVPREHALQAVSLQAAVHRVAHARLTYLDGAAAAGDFPLSNLDLFQPGAAVEVLTGSGAQPVLLFKGVVTGQRLRVRDHASPLLQVDLEHAAGAMTRSRRSAHYFEQTDSEAIEALCQAAGVPAEVEATALRHAQLVQQQCSDWDFLVSRAAANGLMVYTRGETLALRAPALGSTVAQLRFGATLLSLDLQVDARLQLGGAQASTWAAADQAMAPADGRTPAFRPPGNFDPAALADAVGVPQAQWAFAALADGEAEALASARWQQRRVDLVCGVVSCMGLPNVWPGDTVTLAGVGQRFSGDVLVTGVRHEFDTGQGWKTHLQLGGATPEPALRERLQAQPVSTLLAPAGGLQLGVVTDIEDPLGEFRVRVRLPLADDAGEGLWARVATLDAGDQRGSFFRPEPDDEVLVGFLGDDPRHPVVLGMLHSSAKPAPLSPSSGNPQKGLFSREGLQLLFDDDQKSITLSTPGGNRLVLDDSAQGVRLEDQNGHRLSLGPGGVTLESSAALTLKAATEGTLQATTSLNVKAAVGLTLEGTASNDIKSGGLVKVAGSSIQLG